MPRTPFKTLTEVKKANAALGQHWFDKATLEFFDTRIETPLNGGLVFITSEKAPGLEQPRRFTIRYVKADGAVATLGEFGQFASLPEALDGLSLFREADLEDD